MVRRVLQDATNGVCDFCRQVETATDRPVINLSHLAEVLDEVSGRIYNHEGQFFDSQQIMTPLRTDEVVGTLCDGCVTPEVLEVIAPVLADIIGEELVWFEPYDMDHEASVEFEWNDFEQSIKHESRLLSRPTSGTPKTAPERNYEFVRSLLVYAEEQTGLVNELHQGTEFYRARSERDSRNFERAARDAPEAELGPVPENLAAAGRMNAQGISLFYAAFDAETACAEVSSHSPYDIAVVGTFILQQPLRILDLTQSLPRRSVFDDSPPVKDHERLESLAYYVQRITQPVILDGNHPVDYAPTQILTDAFRYWASPPIDGIAYPSRVRKGGKNVVLFYGDSRWFECVGKPGSRFERFQRNQERGTPAPIFVIDPKTVRRYRVDRNIAVQRTLK